MELRRRERGRGSDILSNTGHLLVDILMDEYNLDVLKSQSFDNVLDSDNHSDFPMQR